MTQPQVRRDLVDVKFLVERHGEEIAPDARFAAVVAGEDADVPVGLDELAREELPLPGHGEGLVLDPRDLVQIERSGGPEAVRPRPGLTDGRHASPPPRWAANRSPRGSTRARRAPRRRRAPAPRPGSGWGGARLPAATTGDPRAGRSPPRRRRSRSRGRGRRGRPRPRAP